MHWRLWCSLIKGVVEEGGNLYQSRNVVAAIGVKIKLFGNKFWLGVPYVYVVTLFLSNFGGLLYE